MLLAFVYEGRCETNIISLERVARRRPRAAARKSHSFRFSRTSLVFYAYFSSLRSDVSRRGICGEHAAGGIEHGPPQAKPAAGAGVQGRSPCLEVVGMVNTVKPRPRKQPSVRGTRYPWGCPCFSPSLKVGGERAPCKLGSWRACTRLASMALCSPHLALPVSPFRSPLPVSNTP